MRKKEFQIAIEADKPYIILSARNGKAVQAGVNNRIELQNPTGTEQQLWKFIYVAENVYKIENVFCGNVMDLMLAGTKNGTHIHLWENLEIHTQQWKLEICENQVYKIYAAETNQCLDIAEISDQNGASIQIWDDLDGVNQKWYIIDPEKLQIETIQPQKSQTTKRRISSKKGRTTTKPATIKTETDTKEAKTTTAKQVKDEKTTVKKTVGRKPRKKLIDDKITRESVKDTENNEK